MQCKALHVVSERMQKTKGITFFLDEQHASPLYVFSCLCIGLLILTFFGWTTQVTSLRFLLSLAWNSWSQRFLDEQNKSPLYVFSCLWHGTPDPDVFWMNKTSHLSMFSLVFGMGPLILTFLGWTTQVSHLSMFSLVFGMGLLILTFFGWTTQVTSLCFLLSLAWDS
jgi:hypothetical protein